MSMKVRCVTSHLCLCFVCLKSVLSCESNVLSYSDDSRESLDDFRVNLVWLLLFVFFGGDNLGGRGAL